MSPRSLLTTSGGAAARNASLRSGTEKESSGSSLHYRLRLRRHSQFGSAQSCGTKALTSITNGVLRMSEELQGSFSSIEVVVRRRGFAYPWKASKRKNEPDFHWNFKLPFRKNGWRAAQTTPESRAAYATLFFSASALFASLRSVKRHSSPT